MFFYTWKDVDRFIQMKRSAWSPWAVAIEVYATEVLVLIKKEDDPVKAQQGLKALFKEKFEENCIRLDMPDLVMHVEYEIADYERTPSLTPLFKSILYHDTAYPQNILQDLPGVPVISFHSYKGGVGRTLSLLAFAKAWADERPRERLLIVDADIEAPGLTWMVQKDEECLSFLDLLEIIQCNDDIDVMVEQVLAKIGDVIIPVDTDTKTVEHFVLPAYRYDEQVLDMYSSPENIVNGYNKRYVIAEVLSELGKRLAVSAVLVDLRAGISEFSAPLLFDSRVKKYIVTSTSSQSVKGTELLLKYMNKGLQVSEDVTLPEVFLTMSQPNEDLTELSSTLQAAYAGTNEEGFMDNIITELPFASELIRIVSLQQIMSVLTERDFYKNIKNIVRNNYFSGDQGLNLKENLRKDSIAAIHRLARKQLVAENNEEFEVLMTSALKNLIKKFRTEIPTTVVMGAKGSGKTFLYREMLKNKCWEKFASSVQGTDFGQCKSQTVFIPLIASKNYVEITEVFNDAIDNANKEITGLDFQPTLWVQIREKIESYKQEEREFADWGSLWKDLLLCGINGANTLDELEAGLREADRRVVFLIDGLEEIFLATRTSQKEKEAIVGLVRETVNYLRAKYKNIGCVVFLRKDVARNAIEVNYKQFESVYERFMLNWSKNEALRLALWLVNQAVPGFYNQSTDISQASPEAIESHLVKLWGRKLGKPTSNEANSSRWILAALSDFNGQLQARDIIRFLQYATMDAGKPVYNDRYIMPNEIRKAVPKCSHEKLEEVEQEISVLGPIFERLKSVQEDKRVLPFERDTFNLTGEQEEILKQEGYLRIDNGRYYLPEIIRHALKFKYSRGARPKVLSLIFEK